LGLPQGLPSTFLGRYGWIQYFCKAALREPTGLIHKNHQVFIVMNPIDLNLEKPILAEPFKCDIEHRLGGLACVGGGTVKCRVSLDRGGYVPGESISITANITNLSKVTIKSTKAALTEVSGEYGENANKIHGFFLLILSDNPIFSPRQGGASGKTRVGCDIHGKNQIRYSGRVAKVVV
jgi:Arrestin (or S-antigen), C-terminal domain/Arrestin (or S-antigen), N-terminal domain